ncbi:MAG: DegQ family serine endoprotease [Alphaproteobacteria bacterium]
MLLKLSASRTVTTLHSVKAFVGAIAVAGLLQAAPAFARGAPDGFADLSQKLSPAVVNVSTTQTLRRADGESPFPPGSPFDEFFKQFGENGGATPGRPAKPRKVTSLGSGFVVDPSGIVVTNDHVIDGADSVQVIFQDGESYNAKVLGKDDLTDIALLKIDAKKPLPYVKFGNSDKARVGDWVIAIGNPFGLGFSVTAGIISAFDRDIQAGPYDDFIQTDAAINRGNSGGPLFNMDGEVIGINTAIISPTGGSIGLGFAIPANISANVISQIEKFGATRRGWIGVRIQSVSPDLAEGLGLQKATGALVAEVTPGGPAEKAGLKVGDLIVKFDGKDVSTMRALPRTVAETEIGRTVPVEVVRESQHKSFSVKVSKLDEKLFASNEGDPSAQPQKSAIVTDTVMGLQLTKLTPALRQKYQVPTTVDGVLITDVDDSSPASGQLAEGDVITEIGQAKVHNPSDVQKELKAAKQTDKKVVLMMVNRQGAAQFQGFRLAD